VASKVASLIASPPPRRSTAAHDAAFGEVDPIAVIDSLGLHDENRGGSVVPLNAGAVAVITESFDEVGSGRSIKRGAGRQCRHRHGRFVSVSIGIPLEYGFLPLSVVFEPLSPYTRSGSNG
jgi:hypothetical protein